MKFNMEDEIQRQQNYKEHRLRVQQATSLVNSQAPRPKPTNEEMRNLTYIQMLRTLVRESGQKIEMKTSAYKMQDIRKHFEMDTDKITNNSKEFPIPFHIWQRYEHLAFINNLTLMQRLLRPNIYLDLVTNNQQPLGRLVIQLFTEACPEVVLQFVNACIANKHDRFTIARLLIPLWLEAELTFDDKDALTSNYIEHDPMAINHGTSAGVLSFPSRYLRGSKLHFISFTMSFTPINVLNGKRIAFGVVRCGQKVLERMQNLEVNRSGKPCKNVSVIACGLC